MFSIKLSIFSPFSFLLINNYFLHLFHFTFNKYKFILSINLITLQYHYLQIYYAYLKNAYTDT